MEHKLNPAEENVQIEQNEQSGPLKLSEQEYVTISESTEYKALVRKKNKFILPAAIFFLVFYFTLPLLSSFTNVLDGKAIGDITWIWIFAFAQFIMVWTLAMLYQKKANTFDEDAEKIVDKAKAGDYK